MFEEIWFEEFVDGNVALIVRLRHGEEASLIGRSARSPIDGWPFVERPGRPELLSAGFASLLRMSKREFDALGDDLKLTQTGGAYLEGTFEVPALHLDRVLAEPAIETFVVEADGACVATGTDEILIDAWLPLVRSMAAVTFGALREFDVAIEWPAYITASLTPLDQVTGTPHFDDDQFVADEGVGIFAIAAEHGGPRIATEAIAYESVSDLLPLVVDQDAIDRFDCGATSQQQTAADRIVILPQFGQLHAGPRIEHSAGVGTRNLLVLRAKTLPNLSTEMEELNR